MTGNKGIRQAERSFLQQDIARLRILLQLAFHITAPVELAMTRFHQADGVAEKHAGKIGAGAPATFE